MSLRHLNLLSLDGGGVRVMAQMMILAQMMMSINPENPPKPCEIFDLIGGSGTGGYGSAHVACQSDVHC